MEMSRMKTYLKEKKGIVDRWLDELLPTSDTVPERLHEAIRYSVFAGGKRIRPILCILTAEMLGLDELDVKYPACSLEFIHTYSLVHDDLPAMDNDDLRRGKPTNHKVFGDAMAILAGDALLTEAFLILKNLNPSVIGKVLGVLAFAASSRGMVGGQALDIQSTGVKIDIKRLEMMHSLKTGALLMAPIVISAIIAGIEDVAIYQRLGSKIGMLFQITDDILDVIGDEDVIGKPVGSDEGMNKATYVSILGLDNAKDKAKEFHEECHVILDKIDVKNLDKKMIFHDIIDYLYNRKV